MMRNWIDRLLLRNRLFNRWVWLVGWVCGGRLMMVLSIAWLRATRPQRERRAFRGYEPHPLDLFVCTYEKSGTNWMMHMAVQVAHRGAARFGHIHDLVPWPDGLPLPGIETAIAPPTGETVRVIKSHSPSTRVPVSPSARYVVVVRDPKDVFASLYHFFLGGLGRMAQVEISPQHFLELYLQDRAGFGSWCHHLASWWSLRDLDHVLVLTFPELKADREACIRRVAQHMRVELSEPELALVLEKTSFAWMREHEAAFTPPMPQLRDSTFRMMRKGGSGDSAELLPPDQVARIDEVFHARLVELGCDFPYDEVFGGE